MNKLYCGDLAVYGSSDFGAITATSLSSTGTLSVTGASTLTGTVTMQGAASVAGTLTLSKSTDAAGNANNSPALIVGSVSGSHLEIDANEIMSKQSGTSTASLYLNNDGGAVYLGGSSIYANGSTFTTPNLAVTNANIVDGKVTGDFTVNGVLNSNEWVQNVVKSVGGQFYICPTYQAFNSTEASGTGNAVTTVRCDNTSSTESDYLYLMLSSTAIDGESYAGATWYKDSKVMFSGTLKANTANYNQEIVFSCTPGTVLANMSNSNKLQIKIKYDKSKLHFQSGNLEFSDVSVMMYRIHLASAVGSVPAGDYPIGIYMKAYGTDNKNSYIDVYGGQSQNPDVRVGLLNGLPTMDNGETPRNWGIYGTNTFMKGVIVSQSGIIGNFTLGNDLRSGSWGQSNSVLVSGGYTPENADAVSIGGSPVSGNTWAFTAGNAFGVTTNGTLYASNGVFSGKITSTTGNIGGFSIYRGIIENRALYDEGTTEITEMVRLVGLSNNGDYVFYAGTAVHENIEKDSTWTDEDWAEAYRNNIMPEIVKNGFSVTMDGVVTAAGGSSFGNQDAGHITINDDGFDMSYGNIDILNFSYGECVVDGGGTAAAPYYTIGRRTNSDDPGFYSVTIGYSNRASGDTSVAIGQSAIASDTCAISIGNATKALQKNTLAMGYNSFASGLHSISVGYYTKSNATCSMAFGYETVVNNNYNTVIGKYNKATVTGSGASATYSNVGDYAFIIGNGTGNTTAARSNALTVDWSGNLVASGKVTTTGVTSSGAISATSLACSGKIGANNSYVGPSNAVALGYKTVVTSAYNTVIGKYNKATVTGAGTTASPYTYTNVGDYALIIGNGTANTTAGRSNALTVDWSGNLIASGDIDGTNITASGVLSAGSVLASGILSAASVTSSGAISGNTITASGALSAASVSSSGAISGTDITASGAIKFKSTKSFDMEDPFVKMKIAQQTQNNRPLVIQFDLDSGYYDIQQVVFTNTRIEYYGRNRSTQAWETIWVK